MKALLVILIIVALLGLGGGGFLFSQNQTLTRELESLKEAKAKVETELAVLKATDLAKEVELLQLKLKNTERDLAAAQKDIINLQNKINNLETNIGKTKPYFNAITAIEEFLGAPFTASSLGNIDAKISLLEDSQVTSQWLKAKETIDMARYGWSPQDFFDTVFLIDSEIRSLLR